MFDDRAGRGARRIELGDALIGRVGVIDVVVGQFLALQLPRGGDAGAAIGRAIKCGALVRILTVAHGLRKASAEGAIVRRISLKLHRKPVGNRGIIGGGARVGFCGKALAQGQRGRALVGGEFIEHRLVVLRLDHDRDVVVVLGGGADHSGAADVDILDAVLVSRALVDGRLERIEIDDQQVDRRNAVVLHRLRMIGIVADREQSTMHVGMQRLDPAVHHFRKAGQVCDIADLQPGRGDRLGGAAGRDQVDAKACQRAGELDQAGLVGNGKQCAGHAARSVGHENGPGEIKAAG